jgi:hypothetical protein
LPTNVLDMLVIRREDYGSPTVQAHSAEGCPKLVQRFKLD